MGKNDFDINFDFEEEYNFDPKNLLGDEEFDGSIDLNAFSDEELGLTSRTAASEEDSFDLDDDMDDFLNMADQKEDEEEDWEEEYDDEFEDTDEDDDVTLYQEEEADADSEFPEDEQPEEIDMDEAMEYEEQLENVAQYEEEDVAYEEDIAYEENEGEEEDEDEAPKKRKKKAPRKKVELPTFTMPPIFNKFFDLYFAPLLHKELREEPADPSKPRRRRKSRQQIFKEFYLPPLLICLSLVLIMSFLIGTISNALDLKKIEDEKEKSQLDASISAAEQAELANQRIVDQAAALATQYNYDDAITLLESINGGDLTAYPDISAKRAEYATLRSQLIEHKEPNLIPNLSFHVLITDMVRAQKDTDNLKGNYNKNFVTTSEFSLILQELYNNGFVLVDFDSFVVANTEVDGTQKYLIKPIKLPEGKKPIMITETMVNYFSYMIDGDQDGTADAKGDGFASKLVLDSSGNIRAEYVDENGQSHVGNYDLVPILEDFIAQNPDFSYQGARAILAVTGSEGIFGYRCNTSYISSKGQSYYDNEVAGAKAITQALRDKGYTIACYTYANKEYGQMSVAEISSDLTNWANEIVSIIGPVDTLVFAKNSNISDYSGSAFNVLYTSGFRYLIARASTPSCEVNTTYVRQNRLLVTGENMRHYPSQFTDLGLFNPNSVLDMTSRGGEIPKS